MSIETKDGVWVGEVFRAYQDLKKLPEGAHLQAEAIGNGRVLISAVMGYSGYVGEHIEVYQYFLISFVKGLPKIESIRTEKEFRSKVYKYMLGRRRRIQYWALMQNHELFGYSEDPIPYII